MLAGRIAEMGGPALVDLPVHAYSLLIVDLDAIHADVALVGERIFAVAHRQRDEAPAICGLALENGKHIDVEIFGEHNILAGSM